jgi:hypothetical protein
MWVLGIQTFSVYGQGKWRMSDNKIIQFPNKMVNRPEFKITDTAIRLHTDIKVADHLTEGLVVNMIHNMNENDIDTENPEFIKDIGFLIELVKAIIYRDMDIKHPMQQMVDIFVNSAYDDEQGLYTEFDYGSMEQVVKDLKEEVNDNEKSDE